MTKRLVKIPLLFVVLAACFLRTPVRGMEKLPSLRVDEPAFIRSFVVLFAGPQHSNVPDTLAGYIPLINLDYSLVFKKLDKPLPDAEYTAGTCFRTDYRKNVLPVIRNLFRDLFYGERKISPFYLRFTSAQPDTHSSSEKVPFITINSGRSDQPIHILVSAAMREDEIFLRLDRSLFGELSLGELITVNNFIYSFFKGRLPAAKMRMESPLVKAVAARDPVYLPDLNLTTNAQTAMTIIRQWPLIKLAMMNSVYRNNLQKILEETATNLRMQLSSPLARIVFLGRLTLKYGQVTSVDRLLAELRETDVRSLSEKIKRIINDDRLELYWFSGVYPGPGLLKTLKAQFKYEITDLNGGNNAIKEKQ